MTKASELYSEAELVTQAAKYHIIIGGKRNGGEDVELTEEVLRSANKLLAVGCLSRDTSHIDVGTAQFMGVSEFISHFLYFLFLSFPCHFPFLFKF